MTPFSCANAIELLACKTNFQREGKSILSVLASINACRLPWLASASKKPDSSNGPIYLRTTLSHCNILGVKGEIAVQTEQCFRDYPGVAKSDVQD